MNTSGSDQHPLPPISVLVVEDEGVVALDMQRRLMGLGCKEVLTAAEASQAVALAEAHRPDVVIMDIKLRGEADGIDAAGIIHERFSIPIVFASAFVDSGAVSKFSARATWLLKPFSTMDLQLSIQAAMTSASG